MQCPHCERDTITFRQWCASDNALRWLCPRCHAGLRATRGTKLALVAAALLGASLVAAAIFADSSERIPDRSGRLLLAASFLLVLYPVGYSIFRYAAAYEVDSFPTDRQWPAGDEEYRDADE